VIPLSQGLRFSSPDSTSVRAPGRASDVRRCLSRFGVSNKKQNKLASARLRGWALNSGVDVGVALTNVDEAWQTAKRG
jgi:hypothetical protein